MTNNQISYQEGKTGEHRNMIKVLPMHALSGLGCDGYELVPTDETYLGH